MQRIQSVTYVGLLSCVVQKRRLQRNAVSQRSCRTVTVARGSRTTVTMSSSFKIALSVADTHRQIDIQTNGWTERLQCCWHDDDFAVQIVASTNAATVAGTPRHSKCATTGYSELSNTRSSVARVYNRVRAPG